MSYPHPYLYLDSSFVGPHYEWCCDLGYPQLDVQVFEDGSWAILEMLNAPVVPSMTRFNYIAKGFKHIELNKSILKKLIWQCDPTKRWIWDIENQKSDEIQREYLARENNVVERAEYAMDGIRRNPDLQERIAKNGVQEILPHNIAKHVPESKLKRL